MKKFSLTILALALALGLALAACDNGTTSSGERELVTYSGISGGAVYTLTISPPGGRVVLAGDAYELAIIQPNGVKRSYGTVISVGQNNTFTLQPAVSGSPSFSVTTGGAAITGITGSITLADGATASPPSTAIAAADTGPATLNGTWHNDQFDMILDNGNFELLGHVDEGDIYAVMGGWKGIYIASGGNLTIMANLVYLLEPEGSPEGWTKGWVNRSQFRELLIQYSDTAANYEAELDEAFLTDTFPYTLTGNTLTFAGMTFTRQ